MRNPEATRLRAEWLPRAHGDVLEVGIGSGLNLPFYSSEVRRVYGVDPSIELQRIARARLEANPIRVEFLTQSAEKPLPLADASIDTAVLTWTLCSIPDAADALRQIKRVLKPSGQLIFLEHGRAPDRRVSVWQDRLTPVWKHIGGGCHLNRRIDDVIKSAGFQISELTTRYLPGPRANDVHLSRARAGRVVAPNKRYGPICRAASAARLLDLRCPWRTRPAGGPVLGHGRKHGALLLALMRRYAAFPKCWTYCCWGIATMRSSTGA